MRTTRREFLRDIAAVGAAIAAVRLFGSPEAPAMPKRKLGKMGWNASIIGWGGDVRPYSEKPEWSDLLDAALDMGINYVDTAPTYGISEVRIGAVMKRRRHEVFLATKTLERGKDAAARDIANSLKRLQTDHVDLLQIHAVNEMKDLDAALGKGGSVEAAEEARKAGMVRHIGISGHARPEVIHAALDRYPFDSILVPISACDFHINDFAEKVVPKARKLGIAVLGMKCLRGWSTSGQRRVTPGDLINYTLSLPVCATPIGVWERPHLEANVAAARAFRRLSDGEMAHWREECKEWATTQNLWWKRT